MNRVSIYLFAVLALTACDNRKEQTVNSHTPTEHNQSLLIKTDSIKKIFLDEETKYNLNYLYLFEDKSNEYLVFLNYPLNQILFYNFKTCELEFKISLDKEGPQGIGVASGLYIKDFDNIYISSYIFPGLIKIDKDGNIIQKIAYGKTSDGYQILPSYTPSSYPSLEPVILDNTMFISQKFAVQFNEAEKTPLTVSVDTLSGSCISYPLRFNIFKQNDNPQKIASTLYSRIYNDSSFIYSPFTDEFIYVTSIDHSKIRKIKVKSKYIEDSTIEQTKNPQKGAKENLELPRYGNLIYDKYRNVYYRFAYHKTVLDNNVNWIGRAVYGRKKFSVIILDDKFQIIGETLFPEGIYNSYVSFVHEDGLYISKDYQMNFEQSEDFATFELFKLTKTPRIQR